MDGVDVSVMGWSSTLVNVSPCTRPSCEEQSCVYQSRCVLASSTNFLVLTCPARCGHCCPTFFFVILPNHLLIDKCHFIVVCTMSCVCVGFVGVCCVLSSDGVWGVDDAVCVSLSTPKKRQHSTRPCLHVMVCTNPSCCMVCGG